MNKILTRTKKDILIQFLYSIKSINKRFLIWSNESPIDKQAFAEFLIAHAIIVVYMLTNRENWLVQ